MEESELPKFELFIKERQYLHNVSPATSEKHKNLMRKGLEQVEKLRIEAEREQLQLVLREVD